MEDFALVIFEHAFNLSDIWILTLLRLCPSCCEDIALVVILAHQNADLKVNMAVLSNNKALYWYSFDIIEFHLFGVSHLQIISLCSLTF